MHQRVIAHDLPKPDGIFTLFIKSDFLEERVADFPDIRITGTQPFPVGLLQAQFKSTFLKTGISGLLRGDIQPEISVCVSIGMSNRNEDIVQTGCVFDAKLYLRFKIVTPLVFGYLNIFFKLINAYTGGDDD